VRDFVLTEELKALLAREDVAAWMLANIKHGAAPDWSDAGQLVYRFEDDEEADRFKAIWLLSV
jgi:hypothetical protein